MYDVITIGGATYDIFMKSKKFRVVRGDRTSFLCMIHGTKVVVEEAYFEIGGGGANVAVGLAKLGLKVACEGLLGKDWEGKRIVQLLKKRKVDTAMLSYSAKYNTALSVILYQAGERTILTFRGASDHLTKDLVNWSKLAKTKWLFISHLSGQSDKLHNDILKLKDKHPEIKIAWNPGSTQLNKGLFGLARFLAKTDLLILNKEEAEGLTKIKIEDLKGLRMKSFKPLFKKLAWYGPKVIAITDGRKGAQAWSGDKIYSYPAFPVRVVANVGAGDAFCAGFLGAIILGKSTDEALRWGISNGASVITQYGAQIGVLNRKEIVRWANKLKNLKYKIKN